jgi:hypothetical protein
MREEPTTERPRKRIALGSVQGNVASAPSGQTEVATTTPLLELAERIKLEHAEVGTAVKRGVKHAMAAGDLLIEAKTLLEHGQWLPWLAEHCAISERTAQAYMRLARHRPQIEANTQRVADFNMRDAIASLASGGSLGPVPLTYEESAILQGAGLSAGDDDAAAADNSPTDNLGKRLSRHGKTSSIQFQRELYVPPENVLNDHIIRTLATTNSKVNKYLGTHPDLVTAKIVIEWIMEQYAEQVESFRDMLIAHVEMVKEDEREARRLEEQKRESDEPPDAQRGNAHASGGPKKSGKPKKDPGRFALGDHEERELAETSPPTAPEAPAHAPAPHTGTPDTLARRKRRRRAALED